jgi:hypothetical protein
MKNTRLIWIGGAFLGLALSLGACEKKSEEPPASVGSVPAPAPDKTMPDQPSQSQGNSDTGTAGPPKPDDASKSQKG